MKPLPYGPPTVTPMTGESGRDPGVSKDPVFVHRSTPSERCDHDTLNIEDIHQSWGLGWVCILCGRPVAIKITHYGSGLASVIGGADSPSDLAPIGGSQNLDSGRSNPSLEATDGS